MVSGISPMVTMMASGTCTENIILRSPCVRSNNECILMLLIKIVHSDVISIIILISIILFLFLFRYVSMLL